MSLPKPYDKTTRNGHTIDQLTNFALYATEHKLGYTPGSLTVVQGSYNAGGVSASAGTHDGGGAVDLTPVEWEKKVHAARAVGFAAWHRPTLPGVWNEHIHMILVGDVKMSPAAASQVIDYRAHRDGLAGHSPDNTWHPTPIPVFSMPTVPKIPGRKVEHPKVGHPEYEGDSIRAINHAAANGVKWIDLNALVSKDLVVVNTHYPLPLRHGFIDPLGLIHPDTRVDELTWEELARLRTKDGGYRIHKMSTMVGYAHTKGVGVELDLKCHIGRGILRALVDSVPNATLAAKTMLTRPGAPWLDLKPAHDVGLPTIALCHRPFIKVPEDAALYIDNYRGFAPRWVTP